MISGNQLEILQHFKSFLFEAKLSSVSVKNYLSDIRRYFEWLQTGQGLQGTIRDLTEDTAKAYLNYLENRNTPQSTINRFLASYRRFLTFLKIEYRYEISSNTTDQIQFTPEKLIQHFRQSLASERKTPATIKNYISDVNHFWIWIANLNKFTATKAFYQSIVDPQLGPNLDKIISKNTLSCYQRHLKDIQTSTSVLNRRESALKKFSHFAYTRKHISENPGQQSTPTTPHLLPLLKNTPPTVISPQSGLLAKTYHYYHRLPLVPYLHLALLILFGSAITIFGYNQVFKEAKSGQAYPVSPVRPNRQLSYQGRLTDNNNSAITEPTEASFKLWNQAEEGDDLYSSGACAVAPDSDGIFNIVIGSSPCGNEIDGDVFSENKDIYLEVSVGGQTLSPRQQIATVGYALNSETLQGYPASPSATENTIPLVNNDGQIILGSLSPSIESASGTFALKGQALTFATNPGSDGNIILAPDGTGQVKIMGGTTKKPTLFVSNANLTTGTLIEGYIGNNTGTGNLLHLASGSKMINRVTINALGQTLIEPAAKGKAAFILNQLDTGPIFTASAAGTPRFLITNDGRVGIGTTSPNEILDIYGRINLAAVGGPGITTDKLYNDTGSLYWDGGKIWTSKNDGTGSGLDADLLDGLDSGQFLRSDRSTAYTNGILTFFDGTFLDLSLIRHDDTAPQGFRLPQNTSLTNPTSGEGYLAWNTTSNTVFAYDGIAWVEIAGGATSSKWQRNLGTLAPLNLTDDLLLGSTATASARFAFFNVASGTPTASISAGATGAISLTATGTIATTNNQTLTLGAAGTGNIVLAPGGTTALTAVGANLTAAGNLSINGNTTIGDASGDTVTANSASWTFANDTNFVLSGGLNGLSFDTSTLSIDAAGDRVGIGTTSPGETLDVAGNATISGNLTFYGGARTIASRLNTTLTLGDSGTGNIVLAPGGTTALTAIGNDVTIADDLTVAGEDLLTSSTTFNLINTTATTLNLGGAATTLNAGPGGATAASLNLVGGSGATGCTADGATGNFTCTGNISGGNAGVQGYWQRSDGTLYPTNISDDVILGSTATSSAKFAFFNVASGTPTASISGSTANAATYLTGNGLLATRNNQSLTLGAAGTGNIVLAPGGTTALTAVGANLTASGTFTLPNSNTLTGAVSFTQFSQGIDVSGNATISGNLTFYGGARTIASRLSTTLTIGDAGTGNLSLAPQNGATGAYVAPSTDNQVDLGISTLRWRNIYGNVVPSAGDGTQGFWQRTSGSLAPYFISDSLNIGATATTSAFVHLAGTAAENSFIFTGNTGLGTRSPLARLDVRGNVGTDPAATISASSSHAALLISNSLGDIFSASATATTRLTLQNAGHLLPGVTGQQNLGSSTLEWANLNLTTTILRGGTSMINVATRTLGGGDWTFGASASVSSNLNVAGTACIGFDPAAGCTGNAGALMIVGATGTGKIDVGTVDPPYSINGEKYATYLTAMIGVREEVTGNLTTNEFVPNVGFRTVINFNNLPKASDLWLFGKVTSVKTKMDELSVLLTSEGSARAWYEIDQSNKLLIVYSSKPTTVSYRLSATRFDGSEWKNTRSSEGPLGFVINDQDQNFLDPKGYFNSTAGSFTFSQDEAQSYSLSVNGKLVQEIESLASALIANIEAGLIRTQKLVSPIAEVDELTVKNRLASPLAEIETVIAASISAETIISETATISGPTRLNEVTAVTLYAANIESPTIDSLNTKYEILDTKYATASSILASIQEKYQNFDHLNVSTETGPNASISGDLSLDASYQTLTTNQIITNSLMVNTALLTNSLNSLEGPLFIQPTANYPINLLAGLMVLTPDGKVTVNGDLIVKGKINANLLALYNENGKIVGEINSSGSAEFKDVATGNIVTRNLIIALPAEALAEAGATASATTNSNTSIGTAIISAGSTELEIRNKQINNSTYVYLTPISDTKNQVVFVKSKQEGVGFTVAINLPIINDLKFNYWLIETR